MAKNFEIVELIDLYGAVYPRDNRIFWSIITVTI